MARARPPDSIILDIDNCRLFTPAIMQEALRRTSIIKAAGPDGVLDLILEHMPPEFHEVLQILIQSMAITGITPPSSLKIHTNL